MPAHGEGLANEGSWSGYMSYITKIWLSLGTTLLLTKWENEPSILPAVAGSISPFATQLFCQLFAFGGVGA